MYFEQLYILVMLPPLEKNKHADDRMFWSPSETDECRFVGSEDGGVSEV